MGRPSRLSKKLCRDAECSSGRRCQGQAGRDLVSGRSPHRPEERPRAAMGAARLAPAPARRPALRERLSVRRHLPGARNRRRARHALCRPRGHAAPSRRGLARGSARRPRRAAPRPRRLAHHSPARRAEEHHAHLPALARPGAQPGREHLAIPPQELALEPRLREPRGHRRGGLRGLAQPPRKPQHHHLHRLPRMGPHRSTMKAVGIRLAALALYRPSARDAFAGKTRFEEFRESLGIAPNMLTRRLNALLEAGLLERQRYSERPPRDEYCLTERGRDFRPVLIAMLAFGNRHFAPEGASVEIVDAKTGKPADPMLVDRLTGRPLVSPEFKLAPGPAARKSTRPSRR